MNIISIAYDQTCTILCILMNYTLHQLRVFVKVCQTKSVTKAAEELFLTQPAVSIQLGQFQSHFSTPLTEVVGRRLYITEFGKTISEAAERVLAEVAEIEYRTQAVESQVSGRLRFAIVGTAQYVLPFIIRDFMQRFPAVEISVDVTNRRRVMQSLQSNDVDFGLVSLLPESDQFNSIELMGNNLHLLAAQSLVPDARPSKRHIESLLFVYRETGSGTRDMMERIIKESDVRVQRRLELSSNEAVKQALIAGLGCSIIPLISVKNELTQGVLRIIPLKGLPIRSTWRCIWRRQKRLSPAADAFVRYVQSEKKHILAEHFGWLKDYAV